MAFLRIDHTPQSVKVNLPLNIILPDPGKAEQKPVRERKVLYLLHGLSDDASGWQRYSSIETYAKAYGLVVVMPSVGRSFYTDQPNGQAYFSYVVDELPAYLNNVFHLSPKREDTLIAGLSMGGYGTFKAAFQRPEQYCAAASLSGVLSLMNFDKAEAERQKEFSYIFGDLTKLQGSQHDPITWLKNAVDQNLDLPKLYITCGKQDALFPANVHFHQACIKARLPVSYLEEDGKHDWFFWDKQIRWFLNDVLGPFPDED